MCQPAWKRRRSFRGFSTHLPFEALSEQFHAAPALLKRLNPRARFSAGDRITVPAVKPFNDGAKPQHDAGALSVSVTVSRDESALRVTAADGTLVFFAPVSSGSTHDPLPVGTWKVTGVTWYPVFHYNPDLFWDANPKDDAVTIKPGPNSPVGGVWIGLDLEHYGLHGTPEPSKIGAAASHGCVRLTNWDAARVAALPTRHASGVQVRKRRPGSHGVSGPVIAALIVGCCVGALADWQLREKGPPLPVQPTEPAIARESAAARPQPSLVAPASGIKRLKRLVAWAAGGRRARAPRPASSDRQHGP